MLMVSNEAGYFLSPYDKCSSVQTIQQNLETCLQILCVNQATA